MRTKNLIAAGLASAVAVGTAIALAPAAGASTAKNVVTYRMHKNFSISGPHTVHPGAIQVKVVGPNGHDLQLAQARHGASKSTIVKDLALLNTQSSTPNSRPIERDAHALGGVSSGHTLYRVLTPGKYFLLDSDNENVKAADIFTLTVKGKRVNSVHPKVTGEILAVRNMSFAASPGKIAHKGTLRFINYATDWHFLDIEQMRKGKTVKDVKKALNGTETFQSVFTGKSYETGVISPRTREITSYSLPKGTYAVLCFWPDRKTGVPHAFMGMYRTIKLV